MKAAIITAYGNASVLKVQELPRPAVKDNEVLVQVFASAVNPIDWKIRQGDLKLITGNNFPRKLGADFSGKLAAVGNQVTDFKVGDWVYGMESAVKGGAYAEYIPVNPAQLVAKPATLSHEEAASLPLAGLTAYQALHDFGKIRSGQKVFIHGASGGVGSLAVQFAKAAGASVTASCSERSRELVASLKPDYLVDYEKERLLPDTPAYDLIFDAHGGLPHQQIRKALLAGGTYLTTQPYPKNFALSFFYKVFGTISYKVVWVKPKGADLEKFNQLLERGQLKAIVDSVFPLEEVAAAHQKSEAGHAHGKIILQVSDQ